MRLFNLTDRPLPKKEVAEPQTFRKAGIILEPGSYCDVPNKFNLRTISAWVNSGKVAVNEKPEWYTKAKEDERNSKLMAAPRKPDPATPTIKPEIEKPELDVAKLELASESDKKPKKKGKKEKKEGEK